MTAVRSPIAMDIVSVSKITISSSDVPRHTATPLSRDAWTQQMKEALIDSVRHTHIPWQAGKMQKKTHHLIMLPPLPSSTPSAWSSARISAAVATPTVMSLDPLPLQLKEVGTLSSWELTVKPYCPILSEKHVHLLTFCVFWAVFMVSYCIKTK